MAINVMKWNSKKMELVSGLYEVPENVLNAEVFQASVQTAVYYLTDIRLSNTMETKRKAYETLAKKDGADPDEVDTAYEEWQDAEEEHRQFRLAVPTIGMPFDKYANAYTISVIGVNGKIEVQDFYDTYVAIIRYAHDFQFAGVQKWTEARKTAFTAVKDAINAVIADRFQIKAQAKEEKESGTELTYKPFDPNFNVKETERIISAVYGKVETARSGNSKTNGTSLKHMTEEQAFTYILREMFDKYGCHVDTRKMKKVAFIF